ncbi:MAG: ATP-binding cassette domain-containing protein [Acidobacteriia bacterium]|nr:ATP-binding cassette domain-containing protein [Terriglobia bacterium]
MLTVLSTQRARAHAAGEHALRVRGVDFSYCTAANDSKALYSGFALDIEQGSVVALMGASGCGKSTLGKMMARIIKPTAGRIEWSPQFSKRADVVYMDQHPMNSIFPWQTVRGNLEYPLEKLGWSELESQARVAYLASLFRLDGILHSLPAQISGGELQRLALARCLSWRPPLVILDEPFSALDRDVKTNIIHALHALATKDGMTVVLITHNVSDALAIGMRYVIVGDRPVRIMSDMEFKSPHPRERGTLDYDTMEKALIACIRDGLV